LIEKACNLQKNINVLRAAIKHSDQEDFLSLWKSENPYDEIKRIKK